MFDHQLFFLRSKLFTGDADRLMRRFTLAWFAATATAFTHNVYLLFLHQREVAILRHAKRLNIFKVGLNGALDPADMVDVEARLQELDQARRELYWRFFKVNPSLPLPATP